MVIIKNYKTETLKEKTKFLMLLLEYCETKRLYGGQCFTDYWCNNDTAGLHCSTTLPTAGIFLQMRT